MTASHNAKQQLRATIRAKRQAMSLKARHLASRTITENIMGHVPFERKDIIAAFYPLAEEVDLRLLLELLEEEQFQTALPCVQEDDAPLIFRRYLSEDTLIAHAEYGMMEPSSQAPTVTPTILLVPLVAADRSGGRLGMGGGFYDRTIAELQKKTQLLTIGVAFDFQLVEHVPTETHDVFLDCIITEKRVVVCEKDET